MHGLPSFKGKKYKKRTDTLVGFNNLFPCSNFVIIKKSSTTYSLLGEEQLYILKKSPTLVHFLTSTPEIKIIDQ
jgi:hypothetical protein